MGRLHDIQEAIEGKRHTSSKRATATAVAVGAAGGALAGVLLAPKSGSETRTQLKYKAKAGYVKGKHKAGEIKDNAKEKLDKAKNDDQSNDDQSSMQNLKRQ